MLVGAFADAGADRNAISSALTELATGGSISWDTVRRRGIAATKFRVSGGEQHKHRHLGDILAIINAANLPATTKSASEQVFQALAEAESAAHGMSIEHVHFHEVGAVDSICDIIGACLALDLLGIDKLYCSPINVGSGTVNTEHGILPVPAPATARLLEGCPVYSRGPALELTTPTGAAFVKALAQGFGAMPPMTIRASGYGAGDRDFPEHSNVVRVLLGDSSLATEATTVEVIEANIDDSSPQVVAWAAEKLLEAGALDVVIIPVQMKKGRPGVILQVIAAPGTREDLAATIFRETSTLGLRFYAAERRVQARAFTDVTTKYGVVRVKSGSDGFAPEYEDARRIAVEAGVPLRTVLAEAAHEYLKSR
ncbi:MAG: hypothetical protein JWN34_3116 [Bryobacterales bacterium]|nr:hypothetical protein [Bryobacterales bacterium]